MLALAASACVVKLDYSNASIRCENSVCPADFVCVDKICLPSDDPRAGDGGPFDAALPDANMPVACELTFGELPQYQYCRAEGGNCVFATMTGGGTCTQACGTVDRMCLGAFGNLDPAPCESTGVETCEDIKNTEICVCPP